MMGVTESLIDNNQTQEQRMSEEGQSTKSLEKILKSIYDRADIEIKTNINNKQIIPLAKGKVFAKRYNCGIMDQFCDMIMTLSVSKSGSSRKEFVDIAKGVHQENQMPPTMSQRLFGE